MLDLELPWGCFTFLQVSSLLILLKFWEGVNGIFLYVLTSRPKQYAVTGLIRKLLTHLKSHLNHQEKLEVELEVERLFSQKASNYHQLIGFNRNPAFFQHVVWTRYTTLQGWPFVCGCDHTLWSCKPSMLSPLIYFSMLPRDDLHQYYDVLHCILALFLSVIIKGTRKSVKLHDIYWWGITWSPD